ncbi:hypothetical protein FOZ60_010799 [Perkinsus olseni]|uniref:Uncharacterized protein n=1 Tax=Perkinsus olseni TaxID=32597 RepID=A0A7J6NES1_PEROL|nr:hypothetical protein FOZ60_010799 [Perkinsus olseni]
MFSGLGGIHPPSQSREGAQRGQGLRDTIRRYGSSLALQVGAGRRTSQSSLGSLSQLNGGGLWQRPGGSRLDRFLNPQGVSFYRTQPEQ